MIEPADDRPAIRGLDLERAGDVLIVRRRVGSWPVAIFLGLWLAFWSVGCVAMGVKVLRDPGEVPVAMIVPFYAAWIFASCIEVLMVFGREEVWLGPDGVRHRLRAIVKLSDRSIPLDQIKAIVAALDDPRSDSSILHPTGGVTIVTLGRPLRVARGLEAMARRQQLAALLDEHLRALTPALIAEPPTGGKGHREWPPSPALPESSPLRIDREYDGFRLTRRYPFSLAAFGQATFLVAFWDGILSVFVIEAVTKRQWLMLLFLSIHAAVGLLIFLTWLWLLVSSFCRRTWTFRPFEIVERFSVFRLLWTRYREPPYPARIELRKGGPTSRRWFPLRMDPSLSGDTSPFAVALVDPDGLDRIVLNGLTEGEARCLESELCQLYTARPAPPGVPRGANAGGSLWDPWLDGR